MEKSSIVRDTTGENFVERKVASSNPIGLLDDVSNLAKSNKIPPL